MPELIGERLTGESHVRNRQTLQPSSGRGAQNAMDGAPVRPLSRAARRSRAVRPDRANCDGLIISVLTEAQAQEPTGWRRTASVARGEGARLAAAVSLVLASAKVRDHVVDGDGLLARGPVAAAARKVARSWDRAGARTGADVGFDTAVLLDAVERQVGIEGLAGPGTPLLTVTEPTETATAAAFAHTAVIAGRPGNAEPLAEAGRLFGRLAHLLDAVEDKEADAASGVWNPPPSSSGAGGTPIGHRPRPRRGAAPRGRRPARHTARTARRRVHRRQARPHAGPTRADTHMR